MIDLIANGFALRKQKTVKNNQNPQMIRNKPASDNPHGANKPAQSAFSASMDELMHDRSCAAADYAGHAEDQSNTGYRPADLLRDSCGWDDFDLWGDKTAKTPIFVQCDRCMHFTPDSIGSGAGIGDCAVGVKWTQHVGGKMPLYRYSERHCVQYKQSTMECHDGQDKVS